MRKKGKRKYTFRGIAENSLNALAESNAKRLESVREKWEQIKIDNKMTCKVCQAEKKLEDFDRINLGRNLPYISWSTECKSCKVNRKKKEKTVRLIKNGLEYNIKSILKEVQRRSQKFKRECDLNEDFLINLYNSQNGICVYSGQKMSFNLNSLERLSIDRIDSNLGYIKTNVVWCCWAANNMKQNLSVDEMKGWISDIHRILN